jgi:protocatechuate 3,4-dioxygenase beta subunit
VVPKARAVTEDDGRFQIKDVPPGEYKQPAPAADRILTMLDRDRAATLRRP